MQREPTSISNAIPKKKSLHKWGEYHIQKTKWSIIIRLQKKWFESWECWRDRTRLSDVKYKHKLIFLQPSTKTFTTDDFEFVMNIKTSILHSSELRIRGNVSCCYFRSLVFVYYVWIIICYGESQVQHKIRVQLRGRIYILRLGVLKGVDELVIHLAPRRVEKSWRNGLLNKIFVVVLKKV